VPDQTHSVTSENELRSVLGSLPTNFGGSIQTIALDSPFNITSDVVMPAWHNGTLHLKNNVTITSSGGFFDFRPADEIGRLKISGGTFDWSGSGNNVVFNLADVKAVDTLVSNTTIHQSSQQAFKLSESKIVLDHVSIAGGNALVSITGIAQAYLLYCQHASALGALPNYQARAIGGTLQIYGGFTGSNGVATTSSATIYGGP
jgi:hypothetical protein